MLVCLRHQYKLSKNEHYHKLDYETPILNFNSKVKY